MFRTILSTLSLIFTGLFAGFLVGVLVLELSLRRFDGTVYAQTQQAALIGLPILAAVLLFPAILCTVLVIVLTARNRDRRFWLTAIAAVLLLVALVVTMVVNVPINLAEGQWDPHAVPADWAAMRDRWQVGHAVRTVAAVAAFAVLAVAVVGRRAAGGRADMIAGVVVEREVTSGGR